MTDSGDYRLYLSEKFEGIHKLMDAQFESVHDKLDIIERQTTKTNGRVTDLEDDFKNHPMTCPNIPKITDLQKDLQKIKDDLLEYNFFKRYPKLSIIIIGFALLMLGLSCYGAVTSLHRNATDKKTNTIIERIDTNTE